jgi:hypothetical protein
MVDVATKIFSAISSAELWTNIFNILKPLSFIAIAIFTGIIIWALRKSTWSYYYISLDLGTFFKGTPKDSENKFGRQWEKINKRIKSPSEANWKLAVINSEEIVESVLTKMGYKGEGIKEKLVGVDESQIPNMSELISSYDIFINILSDPQYKITQEKAIKIVSTFEDFLRHFDLL